jgi:hypothetical protein
VVGEAAAAEDDETQEQRGQSGRRSFSRPRHGRDASIQAAAAAADVTNGLQHPNGGITAHGDTGRAALSDPDHHDLTISAATSAPLARHLTRLPTRLALAVLLLGCAALLAGPSALAAKKPVSCGRQVINDWEDGRIDKSYPVHCYEQALKLVPDDARQYSSLAVDLQRALQAAKANGIVPGGQVGRPFGAKYQSALIHARAISRVAQPYNHRDEIALPEADTSPVSGVRCVIANCGGSVSGLPLPLFILGGLAFLLLAAGTVGMVMRRVQERRLPPPDSA